MRYLPQTGKARAEMLKEIGVENVDDLFRDIPKEAFVDGLTDLPAFKGEIEVERIMNAYANENHSAADGPFFLGAGFYNHHIPASVDHIIQRGEFLTAYTPYQPEIAQGTLQVIFEYQTFIAQLTGQDIANASLYDGATSMAEAALMAMRVTRRNKVCLGNDINPQYTSVLRSYLHNNEGAESYDFSGKISDDTACIIIQSPDFFGTPHAYDKWRKLADESGALLIVVITEIVSLGMLPAPDSADIVCGEGQSIGLPMSFGGPHLGFFACREKFVRQMPGRLCGETVDADGKRGYVLTLSTREQHIRRAKATSNICTNQGLCALAFTIHMSLLGEDGFHRLATLNHERACALADALGDIEEVKVENESFFNEFTISIAGVSDVDKLTSALAQKGIIMGLPLENGQILLTATELTTDADIVSLCDALKESL